MTENEISKIIIECAIEVHRTLGGPGLLESVYEEALVWEPGATWAKGTPASRFSDPLQGEETFQAFQDGCPG